MVRVRLKYFLFCVPICDYSLLFFWNICPSHLICSEVPICPLSEIYSVLCDFYLEGNSITLLSLMIHGYFFNVMLIHNIEWIGQNTMLLTGPPINLPVHQNRCSISILDCSCINIGSWSERYQAPGSCISFCIKAWKRYTFKHVKKRCKSTPMARDF